MKNWGRLGNVHPDDLPRLIEAWAASIEAGQILEIQTRLLRADGVFRWFQVRAVPARDTEGKISDWYVLLTDIDDRKKAEEALQWNERNLSLIISAIPTLIHVLHTDGSVLYASQAVLDYTGLSLEDLQKENYRACVFHPEDVERLREERRTALTRAVPFENEQRVRDKEGRYRWFLIRYNPLLDQQGRVDRWYVAATDIEDRKRAENARVEERTRIAQELHDTLLQTVLSASMQLDIALDLLSAESSAKPLLNRILEIMHRGIEEGRSTIKALRSSKSDGTDLVKAFTGVRQELPVRQDIDFRVRVDGRQQPLSPLVEQETYRIGRKALLNAFCHSEAKRVECELEYSDHDLQLRIRDNGKGIDPDVLREGRAGHFGFLGMRERTARIGGVLNISSSLGTEVQLRIPNGLAFQLSAMERRRA